MANPTKKFHTSDGYTLYFVDGKWVDSLDPDSVDMTFDDDKGWPIDSFGERLEGKHNPTSSIAGKRGRTRGRVNPVIDLKYDPDRGWVVLRDGVIVKEFGSGHAGRNAAAKYAAQLRSGKANVKRGKSGEKTLYDTAKRLALLGAGGVPAVLLANKGKRKSNPGTDAASAAYREFHGREPEERIEFETVHRFPKHTAAIGDLIELSIRIPKERVSGTVSERTVDLSDFGEAWLTRHPRMKQLYVEGGDQSIDLEAFGLDSRDPHEVEYLGELVRCVYYTKKDHLGAEGGEANYHHRFGRNELTLDKTELIKVGYHVPDEQLIFVGGGYEIPAEGIDG